MAQAPHGPAELVCPFHQKKMSLVCHKCPLWMQIRGKDRNTGKEVDEWMCSFTALPSLLVENSYEQRCTGAAVESFRNEMVQANGMFVATIADMRHASQELGPKLISND